MLPLQALNDGQHPLAGTGAGVPSGHVKKTAVQNIAAQLGFNAIQYNQNAWLYRFNRLQQDPWSLETYAMKCHRQCQRREVSR